MQGHSLPTRGAGWLRTLAALGVGIVYFLPVLWMILAAFKTRQDALATPPKLLFSPTLEHYRSLFHRVSADGKQIFPDSFWLYVGNSIVIATSSVLLAILLGGFAAYALARLPVRGRQFYLFYVLVLRMVPPLSTIIPLYVLFSRLGLGGSYVGIILVYTAFNLPFAIWMLKSFIEELPRESEEAAWLDGSSPMSIITRVCLPGLRAGLAATAVIGFLFTWNDFLFGLILTGTATRTLPVAMARVLGADFGTDWGVFAAIGTVYLLPVLLVAFVMQEQLLRGATMGTVPR